MHPACAPRLLVAAPPTLLRHGLLLTLHEAWPGQPASLTTTVPQLLAQLRQQLFSLLIMDCAVTAAPALPALLQQVRQQQPGLPLLLLTGRRRPPLPIKGLLRLLPQQAPPADVARTAAELLARTVAPPTPGRPARPEATAFSPRELEVLALVLADLCNEDIARQLEVSVRTVESHRRALLQKAGVRTPVGLAVRALREGWVGVPDQQLAPPAS